LDESGQRKYIEKVAKAEKLKVDDGAVDAIVHVTEGDLRKIANILQSCAASKDKITEAAVYDITGMAKPADVKRMLDAAIAGRFDEARSVLQDLLLKQGLSGEDVIKEIHSQIYGLGVDERTKVALIDKTGEYEYRLSEGSNDLLQLEALLAQFLILCKK
jgi:replication factor C small subunit